MGKILFDLETTQPSISGKRHGGGIYGEILFRKIIDLGGDIAGYYNSKKWINPDLISLVESADIMLIDRNNRTIESIFNEINADILYSPLAGKEFCNLNIKCKISTLHGLRMLELYQDKYWLKYQKTIVGYFKSLVKYIFLKKYLSSKYKNQYRKQLNCEFVTVSYHTLNAIKIRFPEYKDREIKVFYSPSSNYKCKLDCLNTAPYKYYLMVSGNRAEKNIIRAIEAFEILFDNKQLHEIKVHITGLKSLDDIRYTFRHKDRFLAMGYVSSEELEYQYKNAYGFIYPTLNEGFGYPPLEAMKYGIPIAASSVCSIPEVCGDAVLYFNPYDVMEIANRILQLTDANIRTSLIKKSINQYLKIKDKQDSDLENLAKYLINFNKISE